MSRFKENYRGTAEERFWAKVNKNGPTIEGMESRCWEWIGSKGNNGKYPQININGKTERATRYSYEKNIGPIPENYQVRHYCTNNFCIRPDHLFVTPDRGSWATKSKPLIKKNNQLYKECTICREILPYNIENFGKTKSDNSSLRSYCRQCAIRFNLLGRVSRWDYILWVQAKDTCKRTGIEFNLTRDDIKYLFQRQNGLCYWFKVPLIPSEKARYPFKPSLDRLDLDKGYTIDNIVLCCYVANIGRNHNTVEEFTEFVDVLKKSLNNDTMRC